MTYDDVSNIQVNDMDRDDICTRKRRKPEEEKHEATRLRVKISKKHCKRPGKGSKQPREGPGKKI